MTVLFFLATFGVPATVAARSGPFVHAFTNGDVGCNIKPPACPSWTAESPPGAAQWTFDDGRSQHGAGGAATGRAKLSVNEVDDDQGFLTALTITGELGIEVTGFGRTTTRGTFSADFVTVATTLQLVGSASVDATGTASIGSSADLHVTLDCGAMDVRATASAGFGTPSDHHDLPLGGEAPVLSEGGHGQGACDLNVQFDAGGGTDRGVGGAEHTTATASISLTILAGNPGPSPTPDVDSDGDGMLDGWETDGIPYEDASGVSHRYLLDCDGDGVSDADPRHKDVFVEIDAMDGPNLAPSAADLQPVVDAFARARVANPGPSLGITLHTCFDETDLPVSPFPAWSDFDAVAKVHFGTKVERVDPNAADLLAAKREVFHHAIFGDRCCGDTSSGRGEVPGNELMVTLGGWGTTGGTADQKAAAFMHELGHNLGLGHGGRDDATGADDTNWKPNYYSVMNYTWTMPQRWMAPDSWPLSPGGPGYSAVALADLDEAALDECTDFTNGTLRGAIIPFTYTGSTGFPVYERGLVATGTGFDWNGDKQNPASCDVREVVDVNQFDSSLAVSPRELLRGREDWSHLVLDFRGTPSYANGVHVSHDNPDVTVELEAHLAGILPPYNPADAAAAGLERPAAAPAGPSAAALGIGLGGTTVVIGGLAYMFIRRRRSA